MITEVPGGVRENFRVARCEKMYRGVICQMECEVEKTQADKQRVEKVRANASADLRNSLF